MASVFISHRGSDSPLAEQLALTFKQHGHQVWLDQWEIAIGDSIVAKIDAGLATSVYLVLCLSGAGLSEWMNREWMSALARQLEGKGVKVLPVLLSGGELPAILADIRYANLAKDWARGEAELLKAVR